MSDAAVVASPTVSSAAPVSSPASGKKAGSQKKAAGARAKGGHSKPSHPLYSEMVNNAIKNLEKRGGSSLKAIKKYVCTNYLVNADKLSPFIKRYLKSAVASGALVQTRGKGASGSFKLAAAGKRASPGTAKRPRRSRRPPPRSPERRARRRRRLEGERGQILLRFWNFFDILFCILYFFCVTFLPFSMYIFCLTIFFYFFKFFSVTWKCQDNFWHLKCIMTILMKADSFEKLPMDDKIQAYINITSWCRRFRQKMYWT